jgi:hypothetical protein
VIAGAAHVALVIVCLAVIGAVLVLLAGGPLFPSEDVVHARAAELPDHLKLDQVAGQGVPR